MATIAEVLALIKQNPGVWPATRQLADLLEEAIAETTLYREYNPGDETPVKPLVVPINGLVTDLREWETGVPRAYVTAADFIIAVNTNDDPPYTFDIKKSGGAYGGLQADPLDAVLELGCSDVGAVLVFIKCQDNTGNFSEVETYVLVQDNDVLCP